MNETHKAGVSFMAEKALISGSSRGIGAAIARALAKAGYEVIINYSKDAENALALARELSAKAIRADVSDPEAVRRMFDAVGDIDTLVINAGIAQFGLFTELGYEDWRRIFAVNVDGAFNCLQCALPHMIREKRGSIVIVSSVWGVTGASCEAAYSATKAALIGLTKSLAKELGPSGVRVNCIAPGVIASEMNSRLTPEDVAALEDETPLMRIGTPEEVASLAVFLAGDGASFITGQVIGADGGFGL